MERTDLVAQAVRLALAAGMAGLASFTPAYAQDDRGDVAVQEKVVVTGTRIKRAEIEGPLPVTVITREQIDASGEFSVAELLRTQTFNSFGSVKQTTDALEGTSVNGVDMRGLGGYTLVLVNGRRLASGGNLSMIPLAAVERVEVLREGASAVYGADAMAGVVNIILRRDYMGMHLAYDIGRPDQPGGDEDSYSITGGIGSAKGNVTFGMEVQQKETVWRRDREFSSGGTSAFGFPSTYQPYLDEDDPRNPFGEEWPLGIYSDPRCPAELRSDPDFMWSIRVDYGGGAGECRYAYWGETTDEAANDTKSFFVDANYAINERTEFFARGLFTVNEVSGDWAPRPLKVSFSADTPRNPTNPENPTNYRGDAYGGQSFDLDTDGDEVPDTTVEGPFDLTVFYRNVPGGTRGYEWDDTLLDYVAGLRGTANRLGGIDWELAAQWSQQTSNSTDSGQVLVDVLQSEIDAGAFDLFGVDGPYDDDEVNAARRAAGSSTGRRRHRITGGDGQISFDAMQWANGPVPVLVGFEYRDEDFEFEADDQWITGGFGPELRAEDTSAARIVKSLFAETVLPVLPRLELSFAGRYDDYNDFGTTFNPRASVAFRPLDSLLLRGSAGTGFRAPDMLILNEPPWRDSGWFIDSWGCSQTEYDTDGDGRADDPDSLPQYHPCRGTWHEISYGGNRHLQGEESDNWTLGLVWSPTHDFSLIVDYYRIDQDNQIGYPDAQVGIDREFRARVGGATGPRVEGVLRDEDEQIIWAHFPAENIDGGDTDGVDIEANVAFAAGRLGDVSARLNWTRVLNFTQEHGEIYSDNRVGEIGFPKNRGQLTVNWALGDYAGTVVANYISEQDSTHFYGRNDGEHLESFTTWDLQASYTTPWNATITVGARNVFDRDPPLYREDKGYQPRYHLSEHEVYGRVPYLRFEMDF